MLRIGSTNAELSLKGYNTLLQKQGGTNDIFSDYTGVMQDPKAKVPSGIITEIKFKPGEMSRIVAFLMEYNAEPSYGRTSPLGSGEDQVLKELKVFANEISKSFTGEDLGIDAHEKAAYDLLGQIQKNGGNWLSQIRGRMIREALLERYSANLLVAPISVSKRWNENAIFKNVALASQPAYSATNATYETNMSNAGTAGGASADWDTAFLDAILTTAIEKNIKPRANGKYILTAPSRQAIPLRASLKSEWKDSQTEGAQNAYKQYLGTYANKIEIYEDWASPVVGDSAGNLTAYYKGAGSTDDRTSASGTLYDVGFLMGDNAVIKPVYHDATWRKEEQDFKTKFEWGLFAGEGYNRTVYDNIGTEGDTTALNENSMAVFARRVAITA